MTACEEHHPERFYMQYHGIDAPPWETGVNLAWGVRFPDGVCVLRWRGEGGAVVAYSSMSAMVEELRGMKQLRGVIGAVWLDDEDDSGTITTPDGGKTKWAVPVEPLGPAAP